MIKYLKIFVLLIVFYSFSSSCSIDWSEFSNDSDCESADYSNCDTQEPFNAILNIKVTVNDKYPKNVITLYDGFFEDRYKIDTFIVDTEVFMLEVPVDRRYSLSAEYVYDNKTIIAVDGTEVKKSSVNNCDSVCWSVSGTNIDLRLKK